MSELQENRGPEIISLTVLFLAVTWTLFILRVYARFWISKANGADDWFAFIALCSYSLFGAFVLASVHYGLGRHESDLAQDRAIEARMYYALSTIIYIASVALVKLSIGFLLLRLVVTRRYTYMIIASMVLVTSWSLAEWFFVIFQCRPVQFQWNATIEGGTCTGNFVSSALAFSAMSIASDWFYALIPIPMLWSLKRNLQSKISICLILSLGVIASICPLVRLHYLLSIKNYSDLLYTDTNGLIWTIIEPGIAIMAGSIATFRPLLAAWKVPGFERNGISTIGGTTGNEAPYISFQDLGAPSTTHQHLRDTKSQLTIHSGGCDRNGSEELIFPNGNIMKTMEIAVTYNTGTAI